MLMHARAKSELQKISKSLNQSARITRQSLSVVNGRLCFKVLKIYLLKYVAAAKKQAIVECGCQES